MDRDQKRKMAYEKLTGKQRRAMTSHVNARGEGESACLGLASWLVPDSLVRPAPPAAWASPVR